MTKRKRAKEGHLSEIFCYKDLKKIKKIFFFLKFILREQMYSNLSEMFYLKDLKEFKKYFFFLSLFYVYKCINH